jgi:hypothetical protein
MLWARDQATYDSIVAELERSPIIRDDGRVATRLPEFEGPDAVRTYRDYVQGKKS